MKSGGSLARNALFVGPTVAAGRTAVLAAAGGGNAGGPVSTAAGSVPVVAAGGSVPAVAAGRTAVLAIKRGKVTIRSAAVHRSNQNCDVLVDLTLTDRRLFADPEADGRSEAIQEQHMHTILQNCKNTIRPRLADMKTDSDPSVRVVIQSHCGKHRSVAMAELLAKECQPFAEVALFHMEAHRWDETYLEAPRDEQRAPKESLVIRPVPSR